MNYVLILVLASVFFGCSTDTIPDYDIASKRATICSIPSLKVAYEGSEMPAYQMGKIRDWSQEIQGSKLGKEVLDYSIFVFRGGITKFCSVELTNQRVEHLQGILDEMFGTFPTDGGPLPVYRSMVYHDIVDAADHTITIQLIPLDRCL